MSSNETPFIVGHRGASRDAPENTLASFELAWRQGADAIEGDFRLTSDEHIVCIHDDNTARTAGVKRSVANSTLAELQELDVGAWHSPKYTGARIPTLEEVLSTIHGRRRIYIEVKCGEEIVDPLVSVLEHSRIDCRQITVISFDSKVIHELKAATQNYKAMLLVHFKKDLAGGTRPKLKSILSRLNDIRGDGLSTHTDCVTEDFVHAVMDAGYEHHVWTVDNPETAKCFASWGTRSVTTNIPGEIRDRLAT
jgi:glycerophosphoryl diester phosphodiesterase